MKRPEYAKAAVLREFGKPLAVEEVQVPRELEAGALLVKIEVCSICGTDVHLAHGALAIKVNLPVILGHEMVGRVIEVGPHANIDSMGQHVKVGDRVIWAHSYCGHCFQCTQAKQPYLCINKRMYMYESMEKHPFLMGGFAEYGYVLPTSGRVKVPDDVDSTLASLSSCAFRSVMNAFDQIGGISSSDTVVIQGAGPLGILATGVARIRGAKKVITIGAPEQRLSLATDFGADEVLSVTGMDTAERLERVKALTQGRGGDVVFDFSGVPGAFAEGMDLVRSGGRYMVAGQTSKGKIEFQPSLITLKNVHLQGSISADISHYHKALEFISQHQHSLPFGRMLTNRYGLGTINEALAGMSAGNEIKPLVLPWGDA